MIRISLLLLFLNVSVVFVVVLGQKEELGTPRGRQQLPLSASFLGGDLEKERSTRISHEVAWSAEENAMNDWHERTHEQLSSKILETCRQERDSIDSWTSRMRET